MTEIITNPTYFSTKKSTYRKQVKLEIINTKRVFHRNYTTV